MNLSRIAACLVVVSAMLCAAAAASPDTGHSQAAMLQVENAWIRKLPPPLPNGGYAVLRNTGAEPISLVGVTSGQYGQVMLHRSDDSSGMSTMRHVESLSIPAHGEVELEPGGYHLMLVHPQGEIAVGQQLSLQLRFADGSTLDVAFDVRDATGVPVANP